MSAHAWVFEARIVVEGVEWGCKFIAEGTQDYDDHDWEHPYYDVEDPKRPIAPDETRHHYLHRIGKLGVYQIYGGHEGDEGDTYRSHPDYTTVEGRRLYEDLMRRLLDAAADLPDVDWEWCT